jgi:hypothetical protein
METPLVLGPRAALLQQRGAGFVRDESRARRQDSGSMPSGFSGNPLEGMAEGSPLAGLLLQRDAARMNANEMFQQANQLGLRSMRAMSPDQIRRAYEQERKSTVPNYSQREAAANALQRGLRQGERTVNSYLSDAGQAMVSPQALLDEMARIATTDPSLLGRYSPADLAELLAPPVKVGESAVDYTNRRNGYDPEKAARDAAAMDKLQTEQGIAQISQEFGVDFKALSSSADVPVAQVYAMLSGDADLNAALDDATSARTNAEDKTAYEEALFNIEKQLNPIQLRVFRAYLGI